ncbi:MAG: sulfotransferase family 2 domain-containing protein [Pseudomonadota bacterium]
MLVSHRYRFIYLRTEKTASTSLFEALQRLLEPGDYDSALKRPAWAKYSPIHHGALRRQLPDLFGMHPHGTAAQARRIIGAKTFDSYFKFAVERNPWDRQVSLYHHRCWKTGRTPDFDRDMQSAWYRATEYCRLNNWSIYAIGDEVVVNRLLRFETLARDLGALWADLGIAPPVLERRRSEYRAERPHYASFYSDATRDLVGRWYAREIDALGYRFEPAPEQVPAAAE